VAVHINLVKIPAFGQKILSHSDSPSRVFIILPLKNEKVNRLLKKAGSKEPAF
jgi:hypothetical protein